MNSFTEAHTYWEQRSPALLIYMCSYPVTTKLTRIITQREISEFLLPGNFSVWPKCKVGCFDLRTHFPKMCDFGLLEMANSWKLPLTNVVGYISEEQKGLLKSE